jgi:hypothetical protein
MNQRILQAMAVLLACLGAHAQVNSGSNGSDGAFNPTTNIVINMADHPTGIYQYTSVNISNGVTVTFIPNTNNSPVMWLVQSNCTITGTVSVKPPDTTDSVVGVNGGPGGWRGGNGSLSQGSFPGSGFGPGGGKVWTSADWNGGNGSYATLGNRNTSQQTTNQQGYTDYMNPQHLPGDIYGNNFEMPLLGGSGGSGGPNNGGGGGGGAILIAVSGTLNIASPGGINAGGGNAYYTYRDNNGNWWQVGNGGAGSGGAIRLIASTLTGNGILDARGGSAQYGLHCGFYSCGSYDNNAGDGRIRIEGLADTFTGSTYGMTTRGFTGIIFLPTNQQPRLAISSVAGQPVSSNPTGSVATPDSLISSQQSNPIPILVNCVNVPLNSDIIVEVRPASGTYVSAVGHNNSGTLASSTATVLINMPRGGGTIQAKVAAAN